MDSDVATLLSRTTLAIPFSKFIKEVEVVYPKIGTIMEFRPIMIGYEDANFLLTTTTGKYVVKLFLKERSKENVQSYIRILMEAQAVGVPVTKLITGTKGNLSFSTNDSTPYCITEFFEGDDFQNRTPTIEDMLQVTQYLSNLNTLHFPVTEAYDSWGNKNLIAEYDKNKGQLSREENDLIVPVVEEARNLDFSQFHASVIHGDMQRKHVLKNTKGEYCLLDFGCAANGPKVIELSTFFAWFCLGEDTWSKREEIINKVIALYMPVHNLSQYERDALAILTKAAYAAYYLKTSILLREGDISRETKDWHDESSKMLRLTSLR